MGFWNWEKTPVEVETLLRRFYEDQLPTSVLPETPPRSDVMLFNAHPLVYRERGSFVFGESWEKGDRRFGKEVHECRFGWQTGGALEAPEDRYLFRLVVIYGRFSLTLPWVTTGIK